MLFQVLYPWPPEAVGRQWSADHSGPARGFRRSTEYRLQQAVEGLRAGLRNHGHPTQANNRRHRAVGQRF